MSSSAPPVVLGAGIAGLAAAAALRRSYGEVLVVERDAAAQAERPRRGVPQGAQLHNLLSRAQHHLDQLLPGFTQMLEEEGGSVARVADQTHVHELGIVMPARDLGLRLMCAPRPLIESVARSLLDDLGGVEILPGGRADSLVVAEGAVTGVRVHVDGSDCEIATGLLVDAMGAGSPAPRWLAAIGREPPREVTARSDQWYVTTVFARPRSAWADPRFWLVFPSGPSTRGVLVSPLDEGHWCVSVSGRAGDPVPRTVAQVRDHLTTIHDPMVGALLDRATPIDVPNVFRKTTSTWRRYDELGNPLVGLVPVGDAIAGLNPLFGQGMSIAAWQASELATVLAEAGTGADAMGIVTRGYLARSGSAAARAWHLSEFIQRAISGSDGMDSSFVRRLVEDPVVHRQYVRTWHLLEPPSVLEAVVRGEAGAPPAFISL